MGRVRAMVTSALLEPEKAEEGICWGKWGEYSSRSTMWGSRSLSGGEEGIWAVMGQHSWLRARGLSK